MASIQRSVGRGGRNLSSDVTTVQNLLNRHRNTIAPLPPVDPDGDCGQKTIQAIDRFQIRHLEMGRPDGRVDPRGRTIAALSEPPRTDVVFRYHFPIGPQAELADIAVPYIGARETGNNRMGTDPRMREIFEADRHTKHGTTDGYPWCAAFVSMCTQKLIRNNPMIYGHVRPPYTAGVTFFLTRWAPANGCLIFQPNDGQNVPAKGDIVVYTFSHIGIVRSVGNGHIIAIEGNTNRQGSREGSVVRGDKHRNFGKIRRFIRLPIPSTYDTANQICRPTIEPGVGISGLTY